MHSKSQTGALQQCRLIQVDLGYIDKTKYLIPSFSSSLNLSYPILYVFWKTQSGNSTGSFIIISVPHFDNIFDSSKPNSTFFSFDSFLRAKAIQFTFDPFEFRSVLPTQFLVLISHRQIRVSILFLRPPRFCHSFLTSISVTTGGRRFFCPSKWSGCLMVSPLTRAGGKWVRKKYGACIWAQLQNIHQEFSVPFGTFTIIGIQT